MHVKPYLKNLITTPQSNHYPKIRDALWLLMYLLFNCGSNTWIIVRDVREISNAINVPVGIIYRWLIILERQGYILVKSSRSRQFIHIRGIADCLQKQKDNH